jgi:hypothetical protein
MSFRAMSAMAAASISVGNGCEPAVVAKTREGRIMTGSALVAATNPICFKAVRRFMFRATGCLFNRNVNPPDSGCSTFCDDGQSNPHFSMRLYPQ